MPPTVNWSLYLVTDRGLSLGRPLETIVEQALLGGATVVQLREKNCTTREFIALARRLKDITAAFAAPLIINDRADVALAADIPGLHVGQDDMDWADARRLMGPDAILGLSAGTEEHVLAAQNADVQCLGVGPVFATPTKSDAAPAWGLERLRRIRPRCRQPLVAIGGVNAANATDVIRAGADGLAVVSALCSAPDVRDAARRLRDAIEAARA